MASLLCCWPQKDDQSIDEMFEACLFRHDGTEIMQILADHHHKLASISQIRRPSDDCSLLGVASVAGDATLVEFLLGQGEQGLDDHFDHDDNSPLLFACLGGHGAVVTLLLADASMSMMMITRANHEGTTPIMAAAWRGHLDIVQQLVLAHKQGPEQGAARVAVSTLLKQQDSMGRSARDLAKEWGHHHVVDWIDKQQPEL